MRSATQPYCNTVEYGCVSLRMRFFSQNFGTIKRILPGVTIGVSNFCPELRKNALLIIRLQSQKLKEYGYYLKHADKKYYAT